MHALYELPGGYALFKVDGKDIKLESFKKFKDAAQALEAAADIAQSKLPKSLKKFLEGNVKTIKGELAVADSKVGLEIKKKLSGLRCVKNEETDRVMRMIREKLSDLITGMTDDTLKQMSLGLSHTLNRHVLKFSAEKIDVMVIQAIGLLDDVDKELNTYAMRVKEWYGWHFPEMQKIVVDNIQYAKVVLKMGRREQADATDLSDIVPEDVEESVRAGAKISMGVALGDDDLEHIQMLAKEVVQTSEYRTHLADYLKARMNSIAPNLTAMVGELIGAKLISHAGSLVNLAKSPSSTVQLLGAEKALFRALKSKHDTPKYGLLFHVSYVGQASQRNRGKIARMVANQSALATRLDAMGEDVDGPTLGVTGRAKIETRLRQLEARGNSAGGPPQKKQRTA